jgi:hypothetical protein
MPIMAQPRNSYMEKLMCLLAGRPVIQVKDLWAEAGIDRNRYADTPMESHHLARLVEAGYRPVSVPVFSDSHQTFLLVRGHWASDAFTRAVDPGFVPYLEDGDRLMTLLVQRAQRERSQSESHC